ncbi:MAG: hypothetical protein CEN90_339 [Parcubacteria group bacterium Licking1014_17]|nr:MAG: hypothetical protein CEN90_339 [Parcubacteria group bacterium Licking1014_17]
MNILLITGVYPPKIGGPAKQVYDQARALAARGIKVCVLTFGDKSLVEEKDGVRVFYVRRNYPIFSSVIRYFRLKRALKNIWLDFKPSLVQANSVRKLGYIAGRFFSKRKVPMLIKYAGDYVYETINKDELAVMDIEKVFDFSAKTKFLLRLEKKMLGLYDLIWAQSEFQKNILLNHLGIEPEKVVVLPNLINVESYRPLNSEGGQIRPETFQRPIILSVQRFVPWKNVEAQIHVARRVKDICKVPFLLYMVGGGSKVIEERLKKLAREMSVINEVKLIPQVSPVEIGNYFRQATVFLTSSLYEPFGITIIEAMAAGVPVVALGVGAVPEIIKSGNTGFVVARGENYVDRMAQRIKIILENDELKKYMSGRAIEESQNYDINLQIGKFIDVYEKMTND